MAERWMNGEAREIAIEIVRGAIRRGDLNGTTEACAVLLLLLTRHMAKEEGLDPEDLLVSLLGHAADLVAQRREIASLWSVLVKGGDA